MLRSGFVSASSSYNLSFYIVFMHSLLIFRFKISTLQPGQMNITQETYENIVLQQLREIWTRYGSFR